MTRLWLVGVGALAVTVAVAIAVTETGSGPAAPSLSPRPGPQQKQRLSAREVLLAAAATAESRPATTGAYWQYSTLHELTVRGTRIAQITSRWYGMDGSYWIGNRQLTKDTEKHPGAPTTPPQINGKPAVDPTTAALYKGKWKGYTLQDRVYSRAAIQGLPADPDRLLKWAYAQWTRYRDLGWSQHDIDDAVLDLLAELLVYVPASPKVRAAAFRVLAERPGVRVGGTAKDSQGRTGTVMLLGGFRYIIDPKTTLLLSQSTGPMGTKQSTRTFLEVGWTDRKPAAP